MAYLDTMHGHGPNPGLWWGLGRLESRFRELVKALTDSSSKKHKDLKEQSKKPRKPLTSSAKSRNSDTRKSSSKSTRSSRKPSPLPPVAEEHASPRPPRLSTSQLDVDSRCYELTVSPLADVSEAYDASRAGSQESDVHTERVRIRVFFKPPGVDSAPGTVS